jgi:uncharacterized sulfatase
MRLRIGQTLFLATLLFAPPSTLAAGPQMDGSQNRPNVIVILTDDLGYGDLGCYGHPAFETPSLDRMAQEGVKFTAFYAPVPFCAPTRATLLTGRYPFRSGIVWNPSPPIGINQIGLPSEEVTLGEAFQGEGYATSCIGKWHLGHLPEFSPLRHGFDEYFGILYSNDMHPVQLLEGEKIIDYPVVQATLTRRYTRRALDFIERNKNHPFFLYLAHAMPHKPLAASERFYRTSPVGLYGDVISELDWSVGEVLQKLEELSLDQKTLVVFTSDNGPWYGGSTGGLRGMKGRTWEGGIRVPMIARWPGQIPEGASCGAMAFMGDLFPTVLDLCGIGLPDGVVLDGRDISKLMTVPDAESPHEAIFALRGSKLSAVRSGRWKLHVLAPRPVSTRSDYWHDPLGPDGVTILAPFEQAQPRDYPGAVGGDEPAEMMLFDLETDPAEKRDVSSRYPQVVERLLAMYHEMDAQIPPIEPPVRDPHESLENRLKRPRAER